MVGVHDKMNLSLIDWAIVFAVLGGMFYYVSTTKGLMKSVSDFLAAGRTAGRYVISISSGIAGLGAITIVYYLEMGYVSGFAMSWWGFSSALVILFITVSGWVVYRFRSTRCLTFPNFLKCVTAGDSGSSRASLHLFPVLSILGSFQLWAPDSLFISVGYPKNYLAFPLSRS